MTMHIRDTKEVGPWEHRNAKLTLAAAFIWE